MRHRPFFNVLIAGLAIGITFSAQLRECRGAGSLTVNAGYDLFASGPATTFPGLGGLMGVPVGTFDFGTGPVPVGNTDTIVHRLSDVTVAAIGDTGTARLEMVALQLESVAPVDFAGNGLDHYFVTLQSVRGGPATFGSMDITFLSQEGGTFSSFFGIFFDIRKGSLVGPIVLSDVLTLSNQGAEWGRDPPPGAILIDGVNHFLNGTDNRTDFWPITPFQEAHPNGAIHEVLTATPEPSTWLMGATAVVVGLTYARWRSRT